jgi:putative endonuclease
MGKCEIGARLINRSVVPAKAGIHPRVAATVEKQYYVYLLASKRYGTLYTGVTSDLAKRIYEHEYGLVQGFTKKYNVYQLVYFEVHSDIYEAITREKQIKKWNRQWKINLIEQNNPQWLNLAHGLFL